MQIATSNDVKLQEQELDELLNKIAGLPLFQYATSADHFFEDGRCKLRTLEELLYLKAEYQQIYFNSFATAEGKRVVFHQLKVLNRRIARIISDRRRFN